jgi:hypothetical protein
MIITIDPALPCGALASVGIRCGKPATVANAHRIGGGSYRILPLCQDCVAALARNYGVAGAGAAPAPEKEDAP